MKKALLFLVVVAVFFGGYQTGRLSGSPDLVAYGRQAWHFVAQNGQKAYAAIEDGLQKDSKPQPGSPGQAGVNLPKVDSGATVNPAPAVVQ